MVRIRNHPSGFVFFFSVGLLLQLLHHCHRLLLRKLQYCRHLTRSQGRYRVVCVLQLSTAACSTAATAIFSAYAATFSTFSTATFFTAATATFSAAAPSS